MTIIINGRRKDVRAKQLSFKEVVALAYDNKPPSGPNWVFTVTYRKGPPENPHGSMVEGDTVWITEGMIFNVTATDKS